MISYTISVERLRVLQKGLAQNEDAVLGQNLQGVLVLEFWYCDATRDPFEKNLLECWYSFDAERFSRVTAHRACQGLKSKTVKVAWNLQE